MNGEIGAKCRRPRDRGFCGLWGTFPIETAGQGLAGAGEAGGHTVLPTTLPESFPSALPQTHSLITHAQSHTLMYGPPGSDFKSGAQIPVILKCS